MMEFRLGGGICRTSFRRDTMKFWKPPHEHEELLEEQIESIIQEVQRKGYGFGGTSTAARKRTWNNNQMIYIEWTFL